MKRKTVCTDPSWSRRADCVHCAIRSCVLFADLPPDDLDNVLSVIDDQTYPPNGVIYHEGEKGHALFTIRHGMVKLVRDLSDGKQRIVRLLKLADVAGLEVVIGSNYKHTAIAVDEVEVCRIPLPVIERLVPQHPELSRELMARWQRNVDEADRALVDFSTGTAEERVARLLLYLSSADNICICSSLGRQDMGALLSISTETASRVMAEFKRSGAVREVASERCCHCNLELLGRIANPD